MHTLKIGTLNVNGLTNADKRLCVLHYLWSAEVDIVAIQEPHAPSTDNDF